MGRKLADDLASDVERTLLNTDHFAESVGHQPLTGDAVSIDAIYTEHPVVEPMDNAAGVRQVCTAELLVSDAVGATIATGKGTEVSKITAGGHTWRAVAKWGNGGAVTVRLERHVTSTTKKGWPQGVP